MIHLLHSLKSSTVLDVDDERSMRSRLTDNIVLALGGNRPSDETSFLCPKLQVLRLRVVASGDGVFSGMITARLGAAASQSGVARLKAVHVEIGDIGRFQTFGTPRNLEYHLDIQNLKKLRADGLNVRFFVR